MLKIHPTFLGITGIPVSVEAQIGDLRSFSIKRMLNFPDASLDSCFAVEERQTFAVLLPGESHLGDGGGSNTAVKRQVLAS